MTRYLLLFSLLCCFVQNTLAQKRDLKDLYTNITTAVNSALLTQKGSVEIRGSMYYDRLQTRYKEGPEFIDEIIQVKPAAYYMMFDNVGLGGLLCYSRNTTQITGGSDKTVSTQTAIGPSLKKYFRKDSWRPFATLGYLAHLGDQREGREFDLGIGIMFHLQSTTALSLEVNYGFIRPSEQAVDSRSRILVGIGLSSFML